MLLLLLLLLLFYYHCRLASQLAKFFGQFQWLRFWPCHLAVAAFKCVPNSVYDFAAIMISARQIQASSCLYKLAPLTVQFSPPRQQQLQLQQLSCLLCVQFLIIRFFFVKLRRCVLLMSRAPLYRLPYERPTDRPDLFKVFGIFTLSLSLHLF